MSRRVGLTGGTAFRAVFRHTWNERRSAATAYRGLFDTPGPARAAVTRALREWERHLIDMPEETVVFDAWVEPVTIVHHPGVRYEDGWVAPKDDAAERLRAVRSIVDPLLDSLVGDTWHPADMVRRLAAGTITPEDAFAELGPEWGEGR